MKLMIALFGVCLVVIGLSNFWLMAEWHQSNVAVQEKTEVAFEGNVIAMEDFERRMAFAAANAVGDPE